MTEMDYWKECLSSAADECGLPLSDAQLASLADAAKGAAENMSQAFYVPPMVDRVAEVEKDLKARIEAQANELRKYKDNAEAAIRSALGLYRDAQVSIEDGGEVYRNEGRRTQIL